MTTRHARISAGTAIAAALALSSTGAFAQEAPPTTTDAPPASTAPAATVDTTPAPADTTSAPADTSSSTTTARTKTVRHTTHAAAKPAPVVTHKTTQTVTTHATMPAAAAPVAATAPATVAPTTSTKVAPIVDVNAKPANAAAPAAKPTSQPDETAMIAGGGALALLILGGGAYALTRRRRADEEIWDEHPVDVDEPGTMGRHDPVFEHEPPMVAPSAFAWGNEQAADPQVATSSDDRQPGETWVERAYRGPSTENPSQSLRKRLKRAAFFDKRDREVAAGEAAPVEADAGLPENVAEPTTAPERELEAA